MEWIYDPSEGTIIFSLTDEERRRDWPACERFIEKMKTVIPASDRIWNRDTKEWTVSNDFDAFLRGLAEQEGLHT